MKKGRGDQDMNKKAWKAGAVSALAVGAGLAAAASKRKKAGKVVKSASDYRNTERGSQEKNSMIMKRIIFALTTALMLCTLAQGKNRTVTENDSLGNKQRVIELKDTVIDGKAVTDTLSIMTYENSSNSNSESDDDYKHHSSAYDFGWNIGHATRDAVIAITAIVFVFGFPLIIVFIIFFFRYKNRKAKYRLVEQALASGQPLPENLFKEADSTDIRSKGIKNVFVGIGLFIFLWAITEEFGLGCIGQLVMFTGFGQLVIYYTQQDRAPKSNDKSDNARTVFPEKNAEK